MHGGEEKSASPDIAPVERGIDGTLGADRRLAGYGDDLMGQPKRCHMTKMLSILFLFSATTAGASVQSVKGDDMATLRPVSLQERQSVAATTAHEACHDRAVLLFLRLPDGTTRLLGILRRNEAC